MGNRIITISREFGSGGRELGKRLAEQLGYAYYDREILSAIADRQHLDSNYVENALERPVWQAPMPTFRHSFTTASLFQTDQLNLLLEQRKVLEDIAKQGRDCVIVGRNADVVLAEYAPLSLFVCADMEAKLRRCRDCRYGPVHWDTPKPGASPPTPMRSGGKQSLPQTYRRRHYP